MGIPSRNTERDALKPTGNEASCYKSAQKVSKQTMKAKNTPNLWRDTATKPKVADWSYDSTKVKRKRHSERKRTVKAPERKLPTVNPNVSITVSTVSLASLGLSFGASRS